MKKMENYLFFYINKKLLYESYKYSYISGHRNVKLQEAKGNKYKNLRTAVKKLLSL